MNKTAKINDILPERIVLDNSLKSMPIKEGIVNLCSLLHLNPENRDMSIALGLAVIKAGGSEAGIIILLQTVDRLIYHGRILESLAVIQHGLQLLPKNQLFVEKLQDIHDIAIRAKKGDFKPELQTSGRLSDEEILDVNRINDLNDDDLFRYAVTIINAMPVCGDPAIPLPVPLLTELDHNIFMLIFNNLKYHRVPKGEKIIHEGRISNSIVIVASGHVDLYQSGNWLAKVGTGIALGADSLLTSHMQSMTAVAHEEIEFFELTQRAVQKMVRANIRIVTQLQDSFYKQMRGNILNNCLLFSLFDDFAQYMLIEDFTITHFEKGTIIADSCKNDNPLLIVGSGYVQLTAEDERQNSEITFNTCAINSVIGYTSHPTDTQISIKAIAGCRVTCLSVSKSFADSEILHHENVVQHLTELCDKRVRSAQQSLSC